MSETLLAVAARAAAIPIEKAQGDAALAAIQAKLTAQCQGNNVKGKIYIAGSPGGLPGLVGPADPAGNPLLAYGLPVRSVAWDWLLRGAALLEHEVKITDRDTGSGMAPKHPPYVFERFYHADQARARSTGGAGLGLAIVKKLAEAHGGRVGVSSTPGAGTTFTFTLPRPGEAT